jgi:hypothetical protein
MLRMLTDSGPIAVANVLDHRREQPGKALGGFRELRAPGIGERVRVGSQRSALLLDECERLFECRPGERGREVARSPIVGDQRCGRAQRLQLLFVFLELTILTAAAGGGECENERGNACRTAEAPRHGFNEATNLPPAG